MRKLIPCLDARGKRTAIVKHAHHDFDIDYPGKDSYELRKAGANQVLVGSGSRWAMVVETNEGSDPKLTDFLHRLAVADSDLILVEGFRDEKFPKLEVHRHALEKKLFYPTDEFIIGIAADDMKTHKGILPSFDIENVEAIADFLAAYCAAALDLSEPPFESKVQS